MKQWLEFRAKVIHDFMEKARAAVKSVNPSVKFGVYVGGWYASYYDVGVNWASPDYDTSSKFSWATKKYMDYGYADLMDQMLIGAYASPARVYGTTEWTMQGFCLLAKERTMGACPMVAGGPDVGNWDADDKVPQEEENRAILERAGAKDGDLVLIVGDAKDEVVFAALGALRCECAKQLGILDPMDFKFLWVTEFPMFEYSEEEGRYVAMHHPFTAPMDEDFDKLETDKKNCRAKAYDIVLNGTELGGGSIRISVPEVQQAMFRALGFTDEEAMERFGHLINAFKFGAPPHGGLAYGLDRLVMLMAGADSIRDVIAFPKVQNASEPMTQCPDFVDDKQLDELSINVTRKEAPEENA